MNHKDLDAWKNSMNLVQELYEVTSSFPQQEQFGITSQIRRAAVSVPTNIAEGSARKGNKEYLQFLYIALGSLAELETLILISNRLDYITLENKDKLIDLITDCSKLTFGLIKYIKSS